MQDVQDAKITVMRDILNASSGERNSIGRTWAAILMVAFAIITVSINFLLLMLFTRRRSLRTVSNRFVINLLFISLLSSAVLLPFVILDLKLNVQLFHLPSFNSTIENESSFITNVPSLLAQFTLNFICTASILSILLIGVDQYLAVLHPLRCHSYMNKPKSIILILISYLVSLISAILVSLMNANGAFFPNLEQIYRGPSGVDHRWISNQLGTMWRLGYGIFYLGGIIVGPFITICVIYVLIYRAAHRNSARLRRNHFETPKNLKQRPILPKVQSAPNFSSQILHDLSEQVNPLVTTPKEICADLTRITKIGRTHSDRIPNIITSLKTKISNASAFRYREENRTAKISIIVIVMVLACYAPYGLLFLLNTLTPSTIPSSLIIPNRLAIILLITSNLWSPILFALRNRRVQRELKKFLTLRFRHGDYPVNRRPSIPQIIVQDIETTLNRRTDTQSCMVQVEPFLGSEQPDRIGTNTEGDKDSKSILKRVCSKNWGSYKKCSFVNVPDGCLDARGSFSSASTQISTED